MFNSIQISKIGMIKKIECVIFDSRRLNVAKGYCCLPLKANKYSLSENKENRGFSDSIMWGPVHIKRTPHYLYQEYTML